MASGMCFTQVNYFELMEQLGKRMRTEQFF